MLRKLYVEGGRDTEGDKPNSMLHRGGLPFLSSLGAFGRCLGLDGGGTSLSVELSLEAVALIPVRL